MKLLYMVIMFLLFYTNCSWAVDYLIEETNWGISDYGRCKGTPTLKRQKVKSLEEAAKKFYSLQLSGRNPLDMNLQDEMPPISVLKSPLYISLLFKILNTPEWNLGSYLYKLMLCELHSDEHWVGETFNNELGRNSESVRCILDMLYRIALCLRKIDVHLNCPDVCRVKSLDFCLRKPYTVGTCDSYSDESIEGFKIDWTNNTIDGIKKWLRKIKLDVRYPTNFFETLHTSGYLEQAVNIQKMTARVPHCPCKKFYRYDKVLDGCIPAEFIGSCSGINPCANGGICVEINLEEFRCNCAPAFKGALCELERNPCMEVEDLCGEFRCTRKMDDLTNGYRCECPTGYRRKSTTDPKCVPVPPCGVHDQTGDMSQMSTTRTICLNQGRCVQDPEDPENYFCVCVPGYSGVNCEFAAPQASWSFWSAWSACFWPEVGEVCYKRPYSERTRTCIINSPDQRCIGSRRQLRFRGCEFNSDSFQQEEQLTEYRKERLIKAHELCSFRPEPIDSSPEYIAMQESLTYAFNLDDISSVGDEEAPDMNLPKEMVELHSLGDNTVNAIDLIWLAGWIYAVLTHVIIVAIWIYYMYQLRSR